MKLLPTCLHLSHHVLLFANTSKWTLGNSDVKQYEVTNIALNKVTVLWDESPCIFG